MINVDETGRKCRTSDGRPLVTPEVKWLYHYRQYLFNAGTHYVIFENASNSTFAMESNGVPWSVGSIFANGGNLSFDRIQESLSSGTPTVMLYNTGGVTQTFGAMYNWCVTSRVVLEDECHRKGTDFNSAVIHRTCVVSKEPWTKKFGVSTVSQLHNLVKRAPEHMRRSVAVVDVLHDDPEQVVDTVTGCFASGTNGLPELGLGAAEEDCLLHAWKTHMTFTKNAAIFRKGADIFFFLSLGLTLLSATVAVLITKEDYTQSIQSELALEDFDVTSFLKRLLLIIPITTSVFAAINGKKRYLQKWATLKTAAAQIVAEIYAFRNDVLEYDPQWSSSENEGEDEEDDDHGKEEGGGQTNGDIFNPREVFVKRFQEINKYALDSVGETSLKLPPTSKLDFRNAAQKETFKLLLRQYVPAEVLGGHGKRQSKDGSDVANKGRFPWLPRRSSKKKNHPVSSIVPSEGDLHEIAVDDDFDDISLVDDFVSPMTIETYIECRAKHLLKLLESTAPPLAAKLSNLEMMIIVVGTIGTLLAALDKARWVAITVAAGTSTMNVMQHGMYQQRLASTNSALRELNNNQILMDSLSIVSKRTQEMKGRCVNVVETAILETVSAWTGMTARPSVQVSEGKKSN